MSRRFLIVAPVAVVITAALFFLMRDLIAPSLKKPEGRDRENIEIGRTVDDTTSKPKKRVLDPPVIDEPETQPARPDHSAVRKEMKSDPDYKKGNKPVGPPGGMDGDFELHSIDGGTSPIIRNLPYPGCGRGSGEVVLEFNVEADGTVSDVNVISATSSCFASAAARAAQKWRYRPQVVEGKPVRSGRQRVKVQFEEGQ